ncbi:GMC family oxidoreductase N-terminal domain-containing protein [Streptomyces sp. NPDC059900]|uniref:GMC family oxidoreductase n=1 Tax=Streptomyces sp. NPDC059900 TaxID=3155816 RepID=UPI003429E931
MTDGASDNEADYIVVGAGSAGCIVARRLADTGASVILVEAGADRLDRSRVIRVPGMISIMHSVPQVKKRFDWGYYTTPQEHAGGRRIPVTRGKLLGGSSAINGMLFVRGHRRNYDDWAAAGCTGWSHAEILPSYKRMEDWEDGASELRGAGGPVAVTRQSGLTPASHALVEAFGDALDSPRNDDYNGTEQAGVGVVQMSARDGVRYSASHAYLGDDRPTGLKIRPAAMVTRVVLEAGRCVGVEITDGRRQRQILRAGREVVLSAGVVGSAQILLLSGIGPAEQLRGLGLDVAAELPVGRNLHDHLFVPMTFLAPSAQHRGTAGHFFAGMVSEAVRGGGWLGRTVFEAMAFVRTAAAQTPADQPDLQLLALPWSYPSPNQDAPVRHAVDKRAALTVMPTLIYPKSRGELRLASADPAVAPLIDPGFLSDPDDARFLVAGMKLVREVMAHKRLTEVVTGELHPGPAVADEADLARELPQRIHSVYHPVGTCKMGGYEDEDAVVDPELRVRGIEGLRVADAAVMPSITGGNTNAPAMLIGERCAELMTQHGK